MIGASVVALMVRFSPDEERAQKNELEASLARRSASNVSEPEASALGLREVPEGEVPMKRETVLVWGGRGHGQGIASA